MCYLPFLCSSLYILLAISHSKLFQSKPSPNFLFQCISQSESLKVQLYLYRCVSLEQLGRLSRSVCLVELFVQSVLKHIGGGVFCALITAVTPSSGHTVNETDSEIIQKVNLMNHKWNIKAKPDYIRLFLQWQVKNPLRWWYRPEIITR